MEGVFSYRSARRREEPFADRNYRPAAGLKFAARLWLFLANRGVSEQEELLGSVEPGLRWKMPAHWEMRSLLSAEFVDYGRQQQSRANRSRGLDAI